MFKNVQAKLILLILNLEVLRDSNIFTIAAAAGTAEIVAAV